MRSSQNRFGAIIIVRKQRFVFKIVKKAAPDSFIRRGFF
jgi:hypothetical protein